MRSLIIFFFILFYNQVFAQVTLRGRITDEEEQSVEYAEVSVAYVNDTTKIKKTLTDKTGGFSLSVQKGSYMLSVDYWGENVLTKKIMVSKNEYLGSLKVTLANRIGSVTVTRRRLISRKGDKLIMNVSGNSLFKGHTAFGVLKYAPYLSMDSNSGSISMKGKPTRILENGKPIRVHDIQTYLSTLPSEGISHIEIISNPSSKYEAAGGGGIINIITKKQKKGISGSLKNTIDFSKFISHHSSFSLNTKLNDKLLIQTFFSYSKNKGLRKESRIEALSSPHIAYDYDKIDTIKGHYAYFSNEVIYDMNARHQLGIGFKYLEDKSNAKQNNDLVIKKKSNKTFSEGEYSLKNKKRYFNLNLNHTFRLDMLGQNIKTWVDYYDSDAESNNNYKNLFFDDHHLLTDSNQRMSNSPADNKIFSAQTNYTKPFQKNKLELGAKYSFVDSKSKTIFQNLLGSDYVLDKNLTNDFNYKEEILSGYVQYFIDNFFTSNLSVQLGVRVEYTDGLGKIPSKAYKLPRNYVDFFPSVFIIRSFENKKSLSLSYSRRIDRPSYSSFNPTIFYLTEFTSQVGNPALKPAYTDALELNYNSSKANVMLYYNLTKGENREILKKLEASHLQYQWRNIDNSHIFGLSFSGNTSILKDRLRILAKGSAYYKVYQSDFEDHVDPIDVSKLTFQGRISLSYRLPLAIQSEFSLEYNGPETYGQFETGENYAFYLNLSKKFNKHFSMYLSVTDLFDNLRYTFKNDQKLLQTYQFRNNFSTRYAFSIIYTINTGAKVKKQKLKSSNRDLRSRTN